MYNHNMKNINKNTTILMLGLGFLVALSVGSFFHEIKESPSFSSVFLSLFLLLLGVLFAQKFAKHFDCGCDHKHSEDRVFIGSVLLASLVHTTFDGGILHLTQKEEGVTVFLVVLLTIFIHEVIRMTTLMSVLSDMGYKKIQRWLYVFGVSVFGFALGGLFSFFLGEKIEQAEMLIHLTTGFLYAIIATDVFLFIRKRYKVNYMLVFVGLVVAMLLETVAH